MVHPTSLMSNWLIISQGNHRQHYYYARVGIRETMKQSDKNGSGMGAHYVRHRLAQ
jgi:hypothetical protein